MTSRWWACFEAGAVAGGQVVGVVVAGRFAASRLVFAEDRKRTAEEFKCGLRLSLQPDALGPALCIFLTEKLSLTSPSFFIVYISAHNYARLTVEVLALCGPCPVVCSMESLLSEERPSCIFLVFLVNALNPFSTTGQYEHGPVREAATRSWVYPELHPECKGLRLRLRHAGEALAVLHWMHVCSAAEEGVPRAGRWWTRRSQCRMRAAT